MTKTDFITVVTYLRDKLAEGTLLPDEQDLVDLLLTDIRRIECQQKLQLLRNWMRETDWMHFCDDHPEAKTWGLHD